MNIAYVCIMPIIPSWIFYCCGVNGGDTLGMKSDALGATESWGKDLWSTPHPFITTKWNFNQEKRHFENNWTVEIDQGVFEMCLSYVFCIAGGFECPRCWIRGHRQGSQWPGDGREKPLLAGDYAFGMMQRETGTHRQHFLGRWTSDQPIQGNRCESEPRRPS